MFVWIYNTYDSNFGIENDFTNYLKETCWYYLDKCFSFNFFLKYAFA